MSSNTVSSQEFQLLEMTVEKYVLLSRARDALKDSGS